MRDFHFNTVVRIGLHRIRDDDVGSRLYLHIELPRNVGWHRLRSVSSVAVYWITPGYRHFTTTLVLNSQLGSWVLHLPSMIEIRLQGPQPLLNPASDVGVDGGRSYLLDIRGVYDIAAYRQDVVRNALRQGAHMLVALHEVVRIL